MKLKKNIATSENGFIFNPATGDSFSGNAMASEILLAMKNGDTEAQIKQHLLQKYEVSATQLNRDWEDWIVQLKEANLLEAAIYDSK
ncbi:Coenzyme PQQ synthesis protein D (PqqD) [Mucilaginibacter mallensis]|uniref:Coenzyme PQQ synthesis protein D (PqqD) n=1 Tax=Mucilaginibacter mallensis TaxID=652787 RepID=A0A1H1ZFQ5_MUCMA|nr:PqqD family protein [Mucilaginibacter mallensis]SDT32449.1 Coenzyme PQQ synthesis protein D (PqqD) [Mucilaginibacter mallensis]